MTLRERAIYDYVHHIHHVIGLLKNGKEYYTHIVTSRGNGNVYCSEPLVVAAIKAGHDFNSRLDYHVRLIPKLPLRKWRRQNRTMQTVIPREIAVQSGGSFPPDMSPDGCDHLSLQINADLNTAVLYSEPVSHALEMCGALGVLENPTHLQQTALEALEEEYDEELSPELAYHAYSIRAIKPSYQQFLSAFEQLYPEGSPDGADIREAGLGITEASWDDESYGIPIILRHLYSNPYAHNGMSGVEDIAELAELLGGLTKTSAHVIHSLLHIYDALYVFNKHGAAWQRQYGALETKITALIPDETERRCFFRLLNRNAGLFLLKDGDMYVYPYTISDGALDSKRRQYTHNAHELLPNFKYQILTGTTEPQFNSTPLLPNSYDDMDIDMDMDEEEDQWRVDEEREREQDQEYERMMERERNMMITQARERDQDHEQRT
jgi:hypothetical protein